MRHLAFAAAFTLAATAASAQTPVLTVYAGDYFTSEWGPGPTIETQFEAICDCDLQYSTGDLMPRLLLEGKRTKADVVIGLTSDVMAKARATGLFAPHGQDNSDLTLPVDWQDEVFLPFNYSHTAFVFDDTRMENPPATFDDLLNMPDDVKIVIQDPRTSISGLALVLWVQSVYGDGAEEAWRKLAPKILTVTKDWSTSYGMFTDGEADMVLSYTTSPAYHMFAEEDFTKHAALFPEGHYFLVETVAKIADTDVPELADAFMKFVMSETFQTKIPSANWSLPSALPRDQWPDGWAKLDLPEKVLFYDETEAAALQDKAIEAWRSALTQ
ncbi:thiamine ABC transporter substrate binding subunit [Sulfitobacter alexandrii]|uniref:Thiamine ABC transporter substrate binding subunit n=1 Tax=Sulfitobacter alexandrii TaxID=1917485 RepID=A0A1J0WLH5_9RHOB|nr:thiamine ABC transporter substrate binding subunit [Sulfitobacter alexandrii]APE45217.1 thiamine ABC transporter substrate binding subunit [Sulfitobacter alexandrii]